MKYQNKDTKEIKTYRELKKAHPNVSLPRAGTTTILAGQWQRIMDSTKPEYDKMTQGVREITPVDYVQTWEVYELDEEKKAENLDKVKKAKIGYINDKCKQAIESGFVSSALGTEHVYQSELEDQLNLIGAAQSGIDQLFKCGIDDGSGSITLEWKQHTSEQLNTVLNDGAAAKSSLLQNATMKKTQIAQATTADEVESIVWEAV